MTEVQKQIAVSSAETAASQGTCTLEDALALLPHGPELHLLARVSSHEPGVIECESVSAFPEWMQCAEGGIVPASLIELSAQAASVGRILAIAREGDRRPRSGAVVRIRAFSLPRAIPAELLPLRVHACWSTAVSGAYEVEAAIRAAASDESIGTGRLTIVEF